ncbi:hypothetical protein Mapa_018579 [Marchantia paleacea]|nr:hypothetical protein Mapa_018579 [Marchantia paleacea]
MSSSRFRGASSRAIASSSCSNGSTSGDIWKCLPLHDWSCDNLDLNSIHSFAMASRKPIFALTAYPSVLKGSCASKVVKENSISEALIDSRMP